MTGSILTQTKAPPVNYLCKHFIHSEESSLQDNVRVAANKALWKIKGFSYTCLPRGAKTLWKEFRRLRFQSNTYANEIEEQLIDFACGGAFENFMIIYYVELQIINYHSLR